MSCFCRHPFGPGFQLVVKCGVMRSTATANLLQQMNTLGGEYLIMSLYFLLGCFRLKRG